MLEKEKKQYEEDSKNYERPWELWEYKIIGRDAYTDAAHHPHWLSGYHYRRKQTTFMPEYYSGLNWRDAEHLIGKTVECSNNPDAGWKVGKLQIATRPGEFFNVDIGNRQDFYDYYTYIRTCEETFRHPTINICGVELPKPETVEPELGTNYWVAPLCTEMCWGCSPSDIDALQSGRVHLTEDRAKAWADWWKKEVIDKIKG